MTKEEKIRDFEDYVKSFYFDQNYINATESVNGILHEKWEGIRKDEDTLALGCHVTKRDENNKALEIYSPIVSGLVLLDYEKIDPLIYQTLINVIYNSTSICELVNPFLSERSYTFLISTLYNDNLVLTENQKKFLLDEVFNYNIEIRELFEKLARLLILIARGKVDGQEKYDNLINKIKDKIDERNKYPHLLNKNVDIRYFISYHEMFKDLDKDEKWKKYYDNFFIRQLYIFEDFDDIEEFYDTFMKVELQKYNNFSILLEDTIERVNIRKLARIPFL